MSTQTPIRSRAGFFFTAVLLAYMAAAGVCSLYAMLATFYRRFDDPQLIGWTVGAYFLVAAAGAAVCGRLGDLLGRRRLLLIVLAMAGLGMLIAALSPGLGGIIAGCALLGMVGTLMPLTMGIARGVLPSDKLPLAIGALAAVAHAGSGVAILVAGAVIDRYMLSGGFWMLFGLIAVTWLSVLVFVPPDPAHGNTLRGVNLPAGVLFSPAIAGVFVAMELGRHHGWGDSNALLVLFASLAVLAGWTLHQGRAATPLISVRLLLTPQIGLANLLMVLQAAGAMGISQLCATLFQQPEWTGAGYGLSATRAGAVMMMLSIIALAGSPWSGHIAARHGPRRAALIGSLVVLLSCVAVVAEHRDFWFFVATMVAVQLGISIMLPAVYNLVVEAAPVDRTSEAVGVNLVFGSTFMGVGSQVLFKLLASSTTGDAARGIFPTDGAYTLTFAYMLGMSLLALLVAWLLPRGRREQPSVALAAT